MKMLQLRVTRIATLLALLTMGCAANQRRDTLRDSLMALNVSRDTFVAWDRGHQQAILDAAPSKPDFERAIAEYRATQHKVVESFLVAYRALAVALAASDQASLDVAIAAVGDLITEVNRLRTGSTP